MNVVSSRRWLFASLMAVLTLATISPAFAVKPVTDEWVDTFTNELIIDCGDFVIIENATLEVRRTFFLDDEGNRIRMLVHRKYTGTLTNSVTGRSVSDAPDAHQFMVDLEDGSRKRVGLYWSINVPGEGVVVLEAGNLSIDEEGNVTFHGPHEYSEGGDAVLCAALD